MKSVGFDLDGVLYPWHKVAYRELKLFHNLSASWKDFWKDVFKSYSEYFWMNFLKIETLYSCCKINPQDRDVLYKVADRYPVYYITNRPAEVVTTTKSWIKREALPYPENLIIAEDKQPEISRLNIFAFTDDRIINLSNLECQYRFIYDQAWNEDWITDENYIRIHSLEEILKWI